MQYSKKKKSEKCDDDKSATTGRWTKEEHDQFECGLKKFKDRQWRRIADTIPTRTVIQVRTHAQKYFQKKLRMKKKGKMKNTSIQKMSDDHTGMSMEPSTFLYSPIEQPVKKKAEMKVELPPLMSALQPLRRHMLTSPGFQNNTFIGDMDFLNFPCIKREVEGRPVAKIGRQGFEKRVWDENEML